MKIAISSTGPKLDADMDQRFGRCSCFVVIDPASEKFEVLNNQGAMMSGGAGIQTAQMVVKSGAEAVITGNLGPKAADTLAAAGVKAYLKVSGTVREALARYKAGQLQETSGPTGENHYTTAGAGGGAGAGRGRGGGGRGSGQGMGRGRGGGGRGSGRGMGGGRDVRQERGRRQ